MPMPSYPILCYAPGCEAEALYKVAARWSDGITVELKTYYLSCGACLSGLLQSAQQKRADCRLAPGESLEVPAVYEMHHGSRDRHLKRRDDLAEKE